MLLQQEVRISDQGSRSYAKASACSLHIEETLFGYRLNFNFTIEVYPRENDNPISLLGWEMDLYFEDRSQSVLMGRMLSDMREHARELGRHGFTTTKYFDLRTDEFVQLVDKSHRGDVAFRFRATPHLSKIREAERQYTRGDWNGAASSCRSAWRTILSSAPPGVPPFDHLLAPVIGDPRRREFAKALIKGLNDVANMAVHLEGDPKQERRRQI
jgi:hypothetical protein